MATSKKTPGLGDTTNKTKSSKTKGTTVKKSKEYTIKYEDESGGQPEPIAIFNSISFNEALCKRYTKRKGESGGIYNLVSDKTIEIEGKKKMRFTLQDHCTKRGYVGFYFMPVTDQKILKKSLILNC